MEERNKVGARAGIIGICLNVILATVKLVIGFVSGSVSIVGDAVNNYSDVASSVVTLVSFKLAGKKADKEHPYGHGRAEYVAGFIVSAMVIAVAINLAKSSISTIVSGSELDASLVAAVLLVMSIIVKFIMSVFYAKVGRKIGSSSMKAAAVDSRMDCITTSVALLSVIVMMTMEINIDGYAGLIVALFVVWQGIKSAKETVEPLLGSGAEDDTIDEIKDIATSQADVLGVHDIRVHDYGPDKKYVSMHVEIPGNLSLREAHMLLDDIENEIVDKKLASEVIVHPDPVDEDYPGLKELMLKCKEIACKIDSDITIHDFHMIDHKYYVCINYDVLVPYSCDLEDADIAQRIKNELSEECYQYIDNDFRMNVNVDRG
ncbi:MAG: cation diffusion facilitator family transporter [Saccharofermentans sp.]|nr:cation diffusion facilitator family transporter [Saccharofermentans sp.]